jgi:hypothetical protein
MQDVANFVQYATGIPGIPMKGIHVCKSSSDQPGLGAATCAYTVYLPKPEKSVDDTDPKTKNEFITFLKTNVEAELSSYSRR